MGNSLNIFVPHCSDLLTDYLPHGDGVIAHGFLTNLARRGHHLHVAVERVDVRERLHPNIIVHQVPPARLGRVFSRVEYMFRVRSLFNQLHKRHRFDLIHQLNPVFTGLSLSLVGSRLPLVLGTYVARWPNDPDSVASRGSGLSRALALGRSLISGVQQRQADAIILTTPAALNRLPQPNAVRDRVYMLPHGIDAELFSPETGSEPAAGLIVDRERPSILFFANVIARKGIFVLLDAFASVAQECPNAILRIAGDGSALNEVKRQAAALRCTAQIEFLGLQERDAAPFLYRNCDIYCLPSHGEPYATTVLEAMSCGKPIVITDAGGLPYMVHEKGGKRVPVGDSVLLAKALLELLHDPGQRLAMGRYNRKLVETTMTWEIVVRQLEEIYRQTLKRAASKRRGKHSSEVLLAEVQERI